MEILDREALIKNLDRQSIDRLIHAKQRIQKTLAVEDAWLDFMSKVNFWEWATEFYWDKDKMSIKEFAAFYFLINQIRKDGIKQPLKLKKNFHNEIWELGNGHHRLAIAEILDIKKIPVTYYRNV